MDRLRCGAVRLTVPLRDGAIQVGAVGRFPTATIEVRKAPCDVTVRRTDGVALRAQIIRRSASGGLLRADVFAEPVPALWFRRVPQPDGTHVWLGATGQRARRDSDLSQLVQTIVAFGLAKQARSPG